VIVELPLLLTVPVEALKVAVVADAATLTEAGTLSIELLLDNLTLAPPLGAGWVKATVQVLDEFAPRLDGLHATEEIDTETRLRLALAVVPL